MKILCSSNQFYFCILSCLFNKTFGGIWSNAFMISQQLRGASHDADVACLTSNLLPQRSWVCCTDFMTPMQLLSLYRGLSFTPYGKWLTRVVWLTQLFFYWFTTASLSLHQRCITLCYRYYTKHCSSELSLCRFPHLRRACNTLQAICSHPYSIYLSNAQVNRYYSVVHVHTWSAMEHCLHPSFSSTVNDPLSNAKCLGISNEIGHDFGPIWRLFFHRWGQWVGF